jgi:hypothetical protein
MIPRLRFSMAEFKQAIPEFSPPTNVDFPPRKSAGQSPASLRRRQSLRAE